MRDLHQERGRTFDFHVGLRAAAERDRVGVGDAGADDRAGEIHFDAPRADLVAADNELALGLAGLIPVAGQDVAEGGDAVGRQRVAKPAIGKFNVRHDIVQRENARGVHQQQADVVEFLEGLDAAFDDDHAGDRRQFRTATTPLRLHLENHDVGRTRRVAVVSVARIALRRDFLAGYRVGLAHGERDADRITLMPDRQNDVELRNVKVGRIAQLDDAVVDELRDLLRGQRRRGHFGDDDG